MPPHYTIGQLARAVAIPTSTVRYYERSGLLQPDGRTESNYRFYGTAALERLRFILAAKANGFTLEDVQALLDFRAGHTAPCAKVQQLIEERLLQLETRLEQLQHVQEVLHSALDECRTVDPTGKCRTMDNLNVAASPQPSADPNHKKS
jgi:MerR family mercuric resistance operon transcriptional regulator